jgi:cytochrome c-type biogenesis protein CcmE
MSASQLDRELERALLSSSGKGKGGEGGGPDERVAPSPRKPRGNVGLLVVLLVMAGGIVALVMTSFNKAAMYDMKVDQLKSQAAQLGNRKVRVEGILVHGTIMRRDQPCEYRFTIAENKVELPVRYTGCVVPDTFKDVPDMDLGVVVTGKLAANGSFEANLIDAKCPSKYEMKERRDHGEKMPHQLAPVADTPASQTL